MKLSAQWIRDFVDVSVDDRRLADDLTGIGIAVEGISGEGANTAFEMEVGTNRPDAMNHYGVAREAAALHGAELKPIGTSPLPGTETATTGSGTAFQIDIEDAEGCARYTAQMIRVVKITHSPEAIAHRLALVDQRPINNAADASNYTLWEMGHPTHAFDLDLLQGGRIIVRRARAGETLKTLDGVERKLSPEDLIIADADRPVALAGVMGGFDTMITDKTKNVLVESAWFDPVAVRKTAKRHGLHTDASHRFERGADYGATSLACALVAQRIIESGGGELDGSQIDAIARVIDQAPVLLRVAQVQRILGAGVETHEIVGILKRLGFEIVPEPASPPEFSVRIPSWRLDVEREIDLIEEIARLRGYNSFPNTLPAFSGAVVESAAATKQENVRSVLLALGYNEAVSLTFISHADAEAFSSSPVVELANPLSEEASLMRSSLVPGMLQMLAYNLNRGIDDVRLFESGDIFEASGSKTAERGRVCMGATASILQRDLPQGLILDKSKGAGELDVFRAFKGDVETLLGKFEYSLLTFDAQTVDYYDPKRSARAMLEGGLVAYFGALHPQVAAERKLRQEVYLAEVFTDRLYKHSLRQVRYQPLPRFPGVERDFSFLFEDSVTFAKIREAVASLAVADLRSFAPVEIFRGGPVPAGQYSILLRARFQSRERTLREDEVAEWSTKIVAALQAIGGTQRA
ncbi:MAG TPA: phenylalanine--tRNA ligase subunit beta [Terriglobales bacterium]